jgi:hypothetical protein
MSVARLMDQYSRSRHLPIPQSLPFPMMHNQQLLNQMMLNQKHSLDQQHQAAQHHKHLQGLHPLSVPLLSQSSERKTPEAQVEKEVKNCSPAKSEQAVSAFSENTPLKPTSSQRATSATSPLDLTTVTKSPEPISDYSKSENDRVPGKKFTYIYTNRIWNQNLNRIPKKRTNLQKIFKNSS